MGTSSSEYEYGHFEKYCENKSEYQSVNDVKGCKKSECHPRYINATEFTTDHLPEQFKNGNILRLTKLLADLTVKINVTYISKDRIKPMSFQYIHGPFPLKTKAGKNVNICGSGRIWDIFHKNEREGYENETCPCPNCKSKKDGQTKDVWIIKVYTATHVVFDTDEAKQTECTLFYDSDSSRQFTIYGLEAKWKHTDGDLCILFCVTCDEELKNIIESTNRELCGLWQGLETENGVSETENLAIIVSHPHGTPKQISVGLCKRQEINPELSSKEHRYTYNISTCPGSSGGPIFILGSSCLYSAYCHSGCNLSRNFSSCWRYPEEEAKA